MLCATQNARAEHLKNVVPNSRRQDISQISRFITAAEWYNQHGWPPVHTFPSVIECIPKEKPLEPLIKCFVLQYGWLEGRIHVRVYSDICSAASPVRTPLGIWRAEECTSGHGHEQASQSCSLSFHTLNQGNMAFNTISFGWIGAKLKTRFLITCESKA